MSVTRYRDDVIRRAQGYCEYCRTSEQIVGELTIDHIKPEARGGETALDNLCYACQHCNTFKGVYEADVDATTGETAPLFNPRIDHWHEHFQWDDTGTHILGLTAKGRVTVNRLKFNRPIMVRARAIWVTTGLHPPDASPP